MSGRGAPRRGSHARPTTVRDTRDGGRRRAILALFALTLAAAACTTSEREREVSFSLPVSVREVTTATVEDRILVTGALRAPEAVSLRAETAGVFVAVRGESGRRLAEGDTVRAGQTIAEITGEDVRLAARTESTRQRYESAKRDYESRKRLFDEGLISEMELRPVEDALADAKLELERSRLTESRSSLVTPISGMILRLARDDQGLPLADGQLVTQGQVLAQIAPISTLIADVDLVGSDVARVRAGMPARVRHHAWEGSTFSGKVIRLAPSVDPQTRTLRAEVEVNNRERRLRPGMFVEVTLIADRREEVPVIPREAVTERAGRRVAFVLRGQKVERRDLVLGYGDDDVIEVRQGVEPGERVVVRGLETLSDQSRVRVTGG